MSDYQYYCNVCESVIIHADDVHSDSDGDDVHESCCDICEEVGDHYYV